MQKLHSVCQASRGLSVLWARDAMVCMLSSAWNDDVRVMESFLQQLQQLKRLSGSSHHRSAQRFEVVNRAIIHSARDDAGCMSCLSNNNVSAPSIPTRARDTSPSVCLSVCHSDARSKLSCSIVHTLQPCMWFRTIPAQLNYSLLLFFLTRATLC